MKINEMLLAFIQSHRDVQVASIRHNRIWITSTFVQDGAVGQVTDAVPFTWVAVRRHLGY